MINSPFNLIRKADLLQGRRWLIILSLPLPVCIALLIWYIFSYSLSIIPDSRYMINSYSDKAEGGRSTIDEVTSTDTGVVLEYTLKEGAPFPYAGISIVSGEFWDMTGYDYINIQISAVRSRRIRLFLTSFVEGFSDNEDPLSRMYCLWEIPVSEGENWYRFSLDDYIVPDWWYVKNRRPVYDSRIRADFSKIASIHIENDSNLSPEVTDRIVMKELYLSRTPLFPFTLALILVLDVLLVIIILSLRKNVRKKTEEPYLRRRKIEIVDFREMEKKKVITTLNEHYTDSELTVKKAAQISGVHYLNIPKILRSEFGLSFPQYLNSLRICEARRLLEQSDMKIIEISFAVGFGNVSHFNRYFRSAEGVSPREYRKKKRKT